MKKSITFIGLDVHKNSIDVAIADDGRNSECYHRQKREPKSTDKRRPAVEQDADWRLKRIR
jgi:hypothetical protein